MPIDFYYSPGSPPCRLVYMVAATLDLELNLKPMDTRTGDTRTPEFLKINPQHTIPTIVDDGFAMWESRATSRYLINKYGEKTSLYPKDLKTRALIDQRVDFDMGTLYPRSRECYWPIVTGGARADEAVYMKLDDALNVLNTFLEGQKFAVGSELTLADLALVSTVSTIDGAGIATIESYPNVAKWYELMKTTVPKYYETNGKGVDMFKAYVAQIKAKNNA